jgi:predicted RNase H-like nuclease
MVFFTETVVGVDGCAGGWVCLALDLKSRKNL